MIENRQSVGIVGLGSMGLGMAGTLLRRGFAVAGFDLSPDRMAAAAALGADAAASAADLFPPRRFPRLLAADRARCRERPRRRRGGPGGAIRWTG